jgi:hypothetical protein
MKYKTDKPGRHKDGSGHHHPMGVFPIEQKVQHFAPSLVIFPSTSAQSRDEFVAQMACLDQDGRQVHNRLYERSVRKRNRELI